ncbi:hypothetical protein B9Z55_028744 [Caenorhabditis nigoni]|uniref:Uncharacterized protein n=1 Tax=Caenorhabditis nigoni TaxID=1611254 RepID=A0A2G5SA78_9PELO|nr:hypothetical protein B9Z55_028744 [Caenorhabditis nigoni]
MGNYRFLDLSAVFRLIVIVWIFAADFLSDVVPNRRNFDPAIVNLRLRRFGSVPIFFVIVMWIFTPEFINAVVPNRRNFDATIINLRLRRFGPVAVRFTHRDSFRLTGTLQLSSLS